MTAKPKMYRHHDTQIVQPGESIDDFNRRISSGGAKQSAPRAAIDLDAAVAKASQAADKICAYLDRQTADRIKARDARQFTTKRPDLRRPDVESDYLLSAANGGLGVADAAERDSIEYARNAHGAKHIASYWEPGAEGKRVPTINGKTLS